MSSIVQEIFIVELKCSECSKKFKLTGTTETIKRKREAVYSVCSCGKPLKEISWMSDD